ncbi:MAG: low-complexity protein [Deltaproteobacteria bacterium]|jgi:uncharacterized low-complexity protein|nr:low-complexity protein [Deltaproteobacteria bacterium]MBW2500446.1 low-complexity protein [Deltaproteobacteria bacterium]
MARKSRLNSITLALGTAFAASLGQAAEPVAEANAFGIVELPGGYQVASAEEGKCGEGKCGGGKSDEGKCGGGSDDGGGKDAEGKCGEGKCGGAA